MKNFYLNSKLVKNPIATVLNRFASDILDVETHFKDKLRNVDRDSELLNSSVASGKIIDVAVDLQNLSVIARINLETHSTIRRLYAESAEVKGSTICVSDPTRILKGLGIHTRKDWGEADQTNCEKFIDYVCRALGSEEGIVLRDKVADGFIDCYSQIKFTEGKHKMRIFVLLDGIDEAFIVLVPKAGKKSRKRMYDAMTDYVLNLNQKALPSK
jgi:hypothetical protein